MNNVLYQIIISVYTISEVIVSCGISVFIRKQVHL